LRIPRDYTGLFIANADTIYNHKTPEEIRQAELAAQMSETTIHVVRSGEVLGSIARRYGTSVGEIQRLNNIRGTLIRPGQRLVVRAPARPATTVASTNANTHVVRRGETLGVIAGRYRVSVGQLRQWNNISGTTIYAGQNLIVRQPENFAGQEQSATPEPDPEELAQDEEETDGYIWYIIQHGDTLYDIAEKHEDLSIEELKELNDNLSSSPLIPGQRIIIGIEE
jgi:LysM repeat protein